MALYVSLAIKNKDNYGNLHSRYLRRERAVGRASYVIIIIIIIIGGACNEKLLC